MAIHSFARSFMQHRYYEREVYTLTKKCAYFACTSICFELYESRVYMHMLCMPFSYCMCILSVVRWKR